MISNFHRKMHRSSHTLIILLIVLLIVLLLIIIILLIILLIALLVLLLLIVLFEIYECINVRNVFGSSRVSSKVEYRNRKRVIRGLEWLSDFLPSFQSIKIRVPLSTNKFVLLKFNWC